MITLLTGIRGRVTFAVLAVSAVLFSLLGTVGFLQIANSGRDAIRERVNEVVDQLEANVRTGQGTVSLSTADGVAASVELPGTPATPAVEGEIRVERTAEIDGTTVTLVGHSSQARLNDGLRSLYRGLWIAIPLAAIASALMAGVATGRALRPVGAITGLAETIGASMTGARVPVAETGDEIERLARTVNEMLSRIERGRQTQRQFTSDAAHELRTPLMALQGELEIVGGHPERVDGELLTRLDALSRRLGERIDDLVLLSTLDEGRPLALGEASLLELVVEEAATVAPMASVSGTDTSTQLDRDLIARAIRNLLVNARRHATASVEASVVADGDRLWLHVDDDGPGIDPAQASHVFGRFSRLDEARGSDGGAGLGLAIVASVVKAHGGGADAAPSPLRGARLSLWLPLVSADPTLAPQQSTPSGGSPVE